jgi:hypothetical protein
MPDHIARLTTVAMAKLKPLGRLCPRRSVLQVLLETTYLATLRSEEGRLCRGSITFANPQSPETDSPPTRRANYPEFTALQSTVPFNVETLVKHSRAIDSWAASIAVFGARSNNLVIWGVLDQLLHHNLHVNRERAGGYGVSGVLTVVMDGIGCISVYHDSLLIGRVRQDQLILREHNALGSKSMFRRIAPFLAPMAAQIVKHAAPVSATATDITNELFNSWVETISRLCIGLRRLGTGGAFLISPAPVESALEMNNRFPYRRLRDAAVLGCLEQHHYARLNDNLWDWYDVMGESIQRDDFVERQFAETDMEDREAELSGAVKLVTSLTSLP